MEKIIYLSKKLKAFTFDEIFLLAEMEKESLEKCLNELVENGTLKQDTQGYIYVEQISTIIKDIIKNSNNQKQKTENFGIFIPSLQEANKVSFYQLVEEFLNEYTIKFCTKNTLKTYKSLCKNNILPFFKNIDTEEINQNTIKNFYIYCEEKSLTPIRFKNTMALLKQILKYAKDNGFTKNNFDFQVKRLSAKNEFNINQILFKQGVYQCF